MAAITMTSIGFNGHFSGSKRFHNSEHIARINYVMFAQESHSLNGL